MRRFWLMSVLMSSALLAISTPACRRAAEQPTETEAPITNAEPPRGAQVEPPAQEKDNPAGRTKETGTPNKPAEPSQVAKIETTAQPKEKAGWIDLLDGKDLAKHWDTKGNWALGDDGVLALTPGNDKGPAGPDQHLWSKQQYKDFEAEFEFKLGDKKSLEPHAAFMFHVPDQKTFNKGIRVRIRDHAPTASATGVSSGQIGEIAVGNSTISPQKQNAKPVGHWNTMRVLVQGHNVSVFLNGEEVNKLTRRDLRFTSDQPPAGAIGFEKFAMPIWLRNIRVRPLEEQVQIAIRPGIVASPVRALAMSADGQRLLIVHDDEIRVWATASGELERAWPIMSIPFNFGHIAALSPDGKTALVSHGRMGGFWLLDVDTGNHRHIMHLHIHSYGPPEFSADGRRLSHGGTVWDVRTGQRTHMPASKTGGVTAAKLSPDGKQLCILFYRGPTGSQFHEYACVFDLLAPSGASANPTELVPAKNAQENKDPVSPQGPRFSLEAWPDDGRIGWEPGVRLIGWSPDGSRIASYKMATSEIHLWKADGKRERNADGQVRTIKVPKSGRIQFVDADHLLLDGGSTGGVRDLAQQKAVLLDLKTGKVERTWEEPKTALALGDGRVFAYSGDGIVLAVGNFQTRQVTIYNLETGKEVRRLDQNVPPSFPGWGPNSRTIAWSSAKDLYNDQGKDVAAENRRTQWAKGLSAGLDLTKLELLRHDQVRGLWDAEPRKPGDMALDAEGNPLGIGWGGDSLIVRDPKTGKSTLTVLPADVDYQSPVSPDRRFGLFTSLRKHETYLYRLDRKPTHLLTIYTSGTDWAVWTPQGYYAATPGGERLIGVLKNEQTVAPLTFYPIDRFRGKLHRPDIIKLVLEKGSVEEAIKIANAAAGIEKSRDVTIDDLLPPRAVLTLLQQDKATVKLKVIAEASVKDQPVTALRLLVDGRPLADGAANERFGDGNKQATAEWSITLPPGKHLLAVLARSPDASSKSNSIEVEVADSAKVHALYVLAIGVSDYEDSTLKLDFAAKDAQDIASGFQKASKGELFQSVHGDVLVNARARKDAILKQFAELRKKANPNDLAVVFFAGHGVKQKDKFYLLSVEAKSDNLAGTAISGDELRKALGEFPCQVLLMLDACHSSAGLKNFRPAVDDITRNLTDDDCGVAVMCAAMAHEKALEKGGNGLFTRAVVQALDRAEGVPYNRHNRLFFVHHLQAYVYDEVSQQSGDRQHPFLSLPWVVESFPVARFASK